MQQKMFEFKGKGCRLSGISKTVNNETVYFLYSHYWEHGDHRMLLGKFKDASALLYAAASVSYYGHI